MCRHCPIFLLQLALSGSGAPPTGQFHKCCAASISCRGFCCAKSSPGLARAHFRSANPRFSATSLKISHKDLLRSSLAHPNPPYFMYGPGNFTYISPIYHSGFLGNPSKIGPKLVNLALNRPQIASKSIFGLRFRCLWPIYGRNVATFVKSEGSIGNSRSYFLIYQAPTF